MTRRAINASEAIDEADSPVEGFDEGTLAIRSQTTGNVKGTYKLNRLLRVSRQQSW